ncbi:MAG: GxxExxY protein [bacterium]|nr:GxxExxY protein [bacterium]
MDEKNFSIKYKEIILPHKYDADFIVYDKIILEIKSKKEIVEEHTKQTLNYLSVSDIKLGIIINFGEKSLEYKRIVL